MTSEQALATALAALGAVFDRTVSRELVDAYALVLGDLSANEIGRATKQALATCKFMPTPAELLELAGKGGPRALAAATAEAWDAVIVAMRKHDYTTSVDFGPLVNAVIHNLGGWLYLCDRSIEQLTWDRKKFEEVYAAFSAKPANELPRTAPLRGQFGGPVVRIAIGGKEPPLMLPEKSNGVPDVVRAIVDRLDERGKGVT